MVGRGYFFSLGGGFFSGANSLFSRSGVLRIHSTVWTWKNAWSAKKPSILLQPSVWSEEFRIWNGYEKSFGSKICPLFYRFMVLTFDQEITVDGCIKPRKKEWYEVPINWYRISTINNSINKENCSKVGALSETLVTNATSVLTCSNGRTSRTEEWNIKESCLDVQLKPWTSMVVSTSLHPAMEAPFLQVA